MRRSSALADAVRGCRPFGTVPASQDARMRRRRVAVTVAALSLLGASVGCANGGDDSGDAPSGEPDLAALSGDAPAARGAGLASPPGPTDRAPLDSFDVGDLAFGEVAIAITGADGEVMGWCVLLAALAAQRQRGLMEVTDLGGYAGMLFVWEADESSSFYMRNTPTPLSIGWFEADGDLVSTADMEPCADVDGCPTYPPAGRYRFALEVPQGRLDDLGIAPGSRLAVGGSCADRRA